MPHLWKLSDTEGKNFVECKKEREIRNKGSGVRNVLYIIVI